MSMFLPPDPFLCARGLQPVKYMWFLLQNFSMYCIFEKNDKFYFKMINKEAQGISNTHEVSTFTFFRQTEDFMNTFFINDIIISGLVGTHICTMCLFRKEHILEIILLNNSSILNKYNLMERPHLS